MTREAGFTLLEMVIAFALLSLSMVAVMSSISTSMKLKFRTDRALQQQGALEELVAKLPMVAPSESQQAPVEVSIQGKRFILSRVDNSDGLARIEVRDAELPSNPLLLETWRWSHEIAGIQ